MTEAPEEPSAPTPRGNQLRWARHRQERDEGAVADVTLGVAASFTAEALEAQLGATLLDAGFADPDIRFGEYNQLHQVSLDPVAMLGAGLDYLILLWRIEDVFERQFDRYLGGDDAAGTEICDGVAELAALVVAMDAKSTMAVVVSIPPYPAGWGVDLRDVATSIRVGRLHRQAVSVWLDAVSTLQSLELVDLDALQRLAGASRIFDAPKWAMYHQPYRSEFWQLLGSQLGDAIGRRTNPPPKCIVVDCDNTLWGGIVGEDGIGGIELGDAFPGRAFQEFQRQLKRLKARGVMLAIVSKNNEADVLEVFERHVGMVLELADITTRRINWQPKSENIESIIAELNIGSESFVFVDDLASELYEVSSRVNGVRCLLVPEELAELPDLLATSGLFRGMRTSAEDQQRTEMMQSEAKRRVAGESMTREEFLETLGLHVTFLRVADEDVARVAQLTQKTNQFNLTTIRRDEKDVRQLVASPAAEVYAIRVSDRFGDYGLVGVAIVEVGAELWTIDTFLLSCRVLGRGVESAFVRALADDAVARGATRLVGRFEATRKNGQVADFFPNHGFAVVEDLPGSFVIDLGERLPPQPVHIDVVR